MAVPGEIWTSLAAIVAACLAFRIATKIFIKSPLSNVPGPNSPSFFSGNIGQLFTIAGWAFHQHVADNFEAVVKIHGLMGTEQLLVSDPKALHHILVKDDHVWEETDWFIHSNKLMFGEGLLSTLGEQHRKQRKMLNPVFSSRHLAEMIPIFYEIGYKLRDSLSSRLLEGPQEIDMLHWVSRTALELVGQSALGYSFDELGPKSTPNEYSEAVKEFAPLMFKLQIPRMLLPYIVKLGPPRFRRFLVKLIPSANVQKARELSDIMYNTSVKIYEPKKQALERGDEAIVEQVGRGKDAMSILLKANMAASEKDRLPENELIGQMTVLTFAAMDTTSGALSRILYLLAQHTKVQEQLRQEIKDARAQAGGADLDYNGLDGLPYLDAVVRETLRLYPPIPVVSRVTRQDIVLPLSNPITGKDGKKMGEILVPSGTMAVASLLRANREPSIWGSDSYEWKPERFLAPLPPSVAGARYPAVYANIMTFIGGRRSCIGFKFSELEMKVVISLLVESFKFSRGQDDVKWTMGPIVQPFISSALGDKAQMPLVVTAVDAN